MTTLQVSELGGLVGQEIGVSEWILVDQGRIQQFADATGDQQFIHTDPVKAAAGPFGTTIAHGFLALSMLAGEFMYHGGMPEIAGAKLFLNYGLNRVRFMSPVKVESRLRSRATLLSVEQHEGFLQMVVNNTIELEGSEKPACIAETVFRVYL